MTNENRALKILALVNENQSMKLVDQYLFLGQLLGIAEFNRDLELISDIKKAQGLMECYLD